MTRQDWEKFGDDLGKIVQEAVDSQDFQRMNQMLTNTISNTLNDVAGDVAKNIKNAQERTRADLNGQRTNRTQQREQTRVRNASSYQPPAKLYQSTTAISAGSLGLGITAVIMAVIFGLFEVGFLIMGLLLGEMTIASIVTFVIIFILMTGSIAGARWCFGLKGLAKRFQDYKRILGDREFCNVQELAQKTGKTMKVVLKDLEKMLKKGWFMQGHLDEQKTCLIVTHRMYGEYTRLEEERKRIAKQQEVLEIEKQEKRKASGLSPEVQKIIDAGDAYVLKIRACNDAIPGEEVSEKIYRMEKVVDRIFNRVEEHPESKDDIRKLMDYYLPTAIKLLEAYEQLDKQPIDGENIRSSKMEIENALDTLNEAFEKILDDLFLETAWDVSSDISVLNTMLAQEGLKK